MRESIRRVGTLTARNFKEIVRDPISLCFLIGLPLLMEILFYFLFHKMTAQFEMKYLAPGIVVFSQAFLTLFAGLLISVDRVSAFLVRLYVSKARSSEFIFGYALALLPVMAAQALLFFLVGGLFDPSLFSLRLIPAVLLSFVTSLFFIALGILVGSLCGERAVGGVSSIAISGQSLLSGMWFPINDMGGGILLLMNCLPFRNATLLVQNALNGAQDLWADLLRPLLIVLAYTVAVFVAAILVFRSRMKAK